MKFRHYKYKTSTLIYYLYGYFFLNCLFILLNKHVFEKDVEYLKIENLFIYIDDLTIVIKNLRKQLELIVHDNDNNFVF